MRPLPNKIRKKSKKKLPIEGIQTESGSQDTPTSEQSGLTIDEMENESTGSLSSIFPYSFSIRLISSNWTKMINSAQKILLKLLSADQIFVPVSTQQVEPIGNNISMYVMSYINRNTT